MDSQTVNKVSDFFEPDSVNWKSISTDDVALVPTPLEMQPNGFVQVAFEGREYGLVKKLSVKSVHDREQIAFWIQWADETQDLGEGEGFPDGVVIAFPVRGDPIIFTMGEDTAPIHAMHWTARKNQVRSVLATGIGTSRPGPDLKAKVVSRWKDGLWTVVITHHLSTKDADSVKLIVGEMAQVGFVVWDGRNMERAGIKAYSPDWVELNIKQ